MKTIERTKPRRMMQADRDARVEDAARQYADLARALFPQARKKGGGRRVDKFLWLDGKRMSYIDAARELDVSVAMIYKLIELGPSRRKDSIRSQLLRRIRFEG